MSDPNNSKAALRRIDAYVSGWVELQAARERRMAERGEREGRELPNGEEWPELDDDGEVPEWD